MRSSNQGIPEISRLEERLLLSGSVVISEFLASNNDGITDSDGEHSDWLELYNPTTEAVDLDGYYLTDDPTLSELWRIPAISIPAGGFKIIFASGEDRDNPAEELHTDFKISDDGEYLGLIDPDGSTVIYDYAPEFPEQITDVSYGVSFDASATESIPLIAEADSAVSLVPIIPTWSSSWMNPEYNDSSWSAATASIGYETSPTSETSYESYFQTDTQTAMYGVNPTILLRIPFNVDNPAELVSLTLSIRYDDGFAAYINGVPVASANSPGTLEWNSPASGGHSDSLALIATEFDASDGLASLVAGENILAIHALNAGESSSDFLCSVSMSGDVAAQATDDLGYFVTPTPGEPNITGTAGIVKDTKFSVDRGFFDSAFELEITCETTDAEIRYTLDGSTPTATHGTIYTGPIEIASLTTLRAAAFKPGYTPSNVDAQTYIFIDDVLTQPDVPTGYPSTWNGDNYTRPGDYGMDPEIVEDPAYAEEMEAAFMAIPTMSITTDISNLFDPNTGIYIKSTRSGMDYERACSVEYFTADGSEEFSINCGIRMRGGASRNQRTTPKHSFRLIFRDMYGDSKLNYPLFGAEATDSFDTIVLRAGSNLSWPHHNGWPVYSENRQYAQYIRDVWAKETQLEMGWNSCNSNYAHLYINGIYWGLYNPGERPSAPFAADYEGGDKDDYDVINSGEAIDGSITAWNQLMTLSQQDLSNASNYQQISDMLDLEAFADYMIMNQYGGNIDWDHHNWHAYRNREAGGKWYFVMWDTEIVFVNLQENRIDPSRFGQFEPSSGYNSSANTLTRMWVNLMANDSFKTMFGDRVHKYMFNDGLLTPDSVMARWDAISDVVYSPIICESARWGDYRRDVYYAGRTEFDDHQLYDRDEEWSEERRRLMEDYFPYRTDVVINQYKSYGAYPQTSAPTFNINGSYQHGGEFDSGDTLTMSATAGTIVYTLDGTDPRTPGGSVSPTASPFTGAAISLGDNVTVSARVYTGGQWSALTRADYISDASMGIVISEVNYNPAAPTPTELAAGFDDKDMFEFIEIHNTSTEAVSLAAMALESGIAFEFSGSALTTLPAGGFVLVVRDEQAFEMRYGTSLPVAGEYTGGLSNSYDTIKLIYGSDSDPIVEFSYYDDGKWPGRADGNGATLVLTDPLADPTDGGSWRSSSEYLGSPGVAAAPASSDIVINEVLTHTDLPSTDFIELYNTTSSSIDISGWFLSDSSGNYQKFEIPAGTILGGGEYIVFDEYDFNASGIDTDPLNDQPGDFGLDGAHGDDVWLMAADSSGNLTRFVDHIEFDDAANGESFARYPDGSGKLLVSSPTKGTANNSPIFAEVVISELMYNSAGMANVTDDDHLEFVELYNGSALPVDLGGWELSGGVDFSFDYGTIIMPGERLVVVDFDPELTGGDVLEAAFRAAYGLDGSVDIVGGYFGQLSNGGENVRLLRPDAPPIDEPDYTPMLTVDEVKFNDVSPWPAQADGQGKSLARVIGQSGRYGSGWVAVDPSPGTGVLAPQGDFNGDGTVNLDDFILLKQNYGTSGASVNSGDASGDGVVNLDDFITLKQNYGAVSTSGVGSIAAAAPSDEADLLAEAEVVDVIEESPAPPAPPAPPAAPAPLPVDKAVELTSFSLPMIPPDEL